MPELRLLEADPCGADALGLLQEAARDARALYPELFSPDAPPPGNAPTPPGGLYLLAYLDGRPVGSGAFRPLEPGAVAELRRLFVSTKARRRGVAWALLERLQDEACSLGYRCLRLETGHKQLPAMALYERFGFRPIPPFGAYRDDPTSRCFEKWLDAAPQLPATTFEKNS